MRRLGARINAALACTVLLLALTACSDDESPEDKDEEPVAGLLTASDMPFEDPQEGSLEKPDPLTQLATGCIGIEQDVLYDAGWTVEARKYFDDDQWSVTTAVFTPPSGSTGDGLRQVRSRADECMRAETAASAKPLALGDDSYAYQVQDGQAVDSARAYVALDDGSIAQISVQEMPSDERPGPVLQDLVDELD